VAASVAAAVVAVALTTGGPTQGAGAKDAVAVEHTQSVTVPADPAGTAAFTGQPATDVAVTPAPPVVAEEPPADTGQQARGEEKPNKADKASKDAEKAAKKAEKEAEKAAKKAQGNDGEGDDQD
jgi:type IV secretory pathway VirB10-like protein